MGAQSGNAQRLLTQEEVRFYDELKALHLAAGEPALAVLVRQSKESGNATLNGSSLNQWLSERTAIPSPGPPFDFLINYLLGSAKTKTTQRLQPLTYYRDLRAKAAKARDRTRQRARGADPAQPSATPSPALREYVRAASMLCASHPTEGVGRLGRVPALSEVYQAQRAIRIGPRTGEAVGQGLGKLAAGDLINPGDVLRSGSCVILAGPGGGKSSLLREVLRAGLDLSDRSQPVPVLVPAGVLAGQGALAEAITRHVKLELGSTWDVPPDSVRFFELPPRPKATWLVLVDGLDEVIDPVLRRRVLEKIRHASRAGDAAHQFVVASRPLGEHELNVLGTDIARLELQPFDDAGITDFVRKWMVGQGAAHDEERVATLMQALQRPGLRLLARIPLMATMLCQLLEANPHQVVADSRGRIFRQFTDLLQERQFQGGLLERAEEALRPYGPQLAAATIGDLPQLMEQLALEHLSGGPGLAAQKLDRLRPAPVPETVWNAVTRDLMRSTGLVTERAGQLVFLHQTLAEYLVARSLADKPTALKWRISSMLKAGGRWPGPRTIWRMITEWGSWHTPEHQDSLAGFLLDQARDLNIDYGPMLHRMITVGGVAGSAFVTRQHALVTYIPPDVLDRALEKLVRAARRESTVGTDRILAAETLLRFGDPRGEQALSEICARVTQLQLPRYYEPPLPDPEMGANEPSFDHEDYERFLRWERKRLADAFARVANNRELPDRVRALAIKGQAVYLDIVEDEERLQALRRLIDESSFDSTARQIAESGLPENRATVEE